MTTETDYKVCINGRPSKKFGVFKCLRQGNPLSKRLFNVQYGLDKMKRFNFLRITITNKCEEKVEIQKGIAKETNIWEDYTTC